VSLSLRLMPCERREAVIISPTTTFHSEAGGKRELRGEASVAGQRREVAEHKRREQPPPGPPEGIP